MADEAWWVGSVDSRHAGKPVSIGKAFHKGRINQIADMMRCLAGAGTRCCCRSRSVQPRRRGGRLVAAVAAARAAGDAAVAPEGEDRGTMGRGVTSQSGRRGCCGAGCCCWRARPRRLQSSCWNAPGAVAGCWPRSPSSVPFYGKVCIGSIQRAYGFPAMLYDGTFEGMNFPGLAGNSTA